MWRGNLATACYTSYYPGRRRGVRRFQEHLHDISLVLLDVIISHLDGSDAYDRFASPRRHAVIFTVCYSRSAGPCWRLDYEVRDRLLHKPVLR